MNIQKKMNEVIEALEEVVGTHIPDLFCDIEVETDGVDVSTDTCGSSISVEIDLSDLELDTNAAEREVQGLIDEVEAALETIKELFEAISSDLPEVLTINGSDYRKI
jgi:hypothetical protein